MRERRTSAASRWCSARRTGASTGASARRLVFLVALLAALALPAAASAASCPKTSLGDVEDEVMCPVCGVPLELATESPQAQREREYIQRLVAQCRSKDQIKRALVAQFGDKVLALPGDEDSFGFSDALVYVLPALGLLLACGAIGATLVRWRRRGGTLYGPPGDDEGGEGAGDREPRGPSPNAGGTAAAVRLDSDLDRYDL